MRNTVREWWVGLARRERVATLAAVVLALAALVGVLVFLQAHVAPFTAMVRL
jgi:hypothetical protein